MIKVIDMRQGSDSGLFAGLVGRNRIGEGDVLRTVEDILSKVRAEGDKAIIEYTLKFDNVQLEQTSLKVSKEEITAAYEKIDPKLLAVIRNAKANIKAFHSRQKENSWFMTGEDGIMLGQLYRPLEVIGIYVPGGTAVLTSSVLMNALPAKVAGVNRIIMATPPRRDGSIEPAVLVAAQEAGVAEIYKMGGAQAIAAMAFGTETVPKADKLFGPGNIYVATAKRLVFGYCDIDMIAGPSEITVVADETANPVYVAADLLSQAEHDVLAASILVTPSEKLADEVIKEIEKQARLLSRKDILDKSLAEHSAVVLVNDLDEAMDIANRIAPEHLELCIEDPFSRLDSVKNAGAVFLGHWSPEPLGDYFAGPNHVLPTGGTARFFSPLNVADYVKKSSVISYTRKALEKVSGDVVYFAKSEGLDAHANALTVRFGPEMPE
jgi:histidinol dehydrogenase